MSEHEKIKSYLIFSFDNFRPNESNPQFRDCTVYIDVLCHSDYWDLGDFRTRPLKICGYIDGILNASRLSGIGTFQFLGCNELVLDETLSGFYNKPLFEDEIYFRKNPSGVQIEFYE